MRIPVSIPTNYTMSDKTAPIDTTELPVVIRTVNPRIEQMMPVIARALTEPEKWNIVHELADQSSIRTTATDLAIKAKQYTAKTKIPPEYQKHAKVFNEEEAQQFPPSRPSHHSAHLKTTAPDSLNC